MSPLSQCKPEQSLRSKPSRLSVVLFAISLVVMHLPVAFASGDNALDSAAPIDPTHGHAESILLPDHSQLSDDACPPRSSGELEVRLGSSSYVTNHLPHTVISYRGNPRMVLDSGKDGGLTITAAFSSTPDTTMITLEKNKINIDTDLIAKLSRPSVSRLLVTGKDNSVVLNIWYANPTTLVIMGSMYFGDTFVDIGQDSLQYGPLSVTGGCGRAGSEDLAL